MRKTNAILFLIIYLFSFWGYYFLYKSLQTKIKKDIKNQISANNYENELIKFVFSDTELQNLYWLKKGKEFLYEACLYDVVKSHRTKNKNILYCISDIKETELMNNFNKIISFNFGKEPKNTQKLIVLNSLIKIYLPAVNSINIIYSDFSEVKFPDNKFKIKNPEIAPPYPPPQHVL